MRRRVRVISIFFALMLTLVPIGHEIGVASGNLYASRLDVKVVNQTTIDKPDTLYLVEYPGGRRCYVITIGKEQPTSRGSVALDCNDVPVRGEPHPKVEIRSFDAEDAATIFDVAITDYGDICSVIFVSLRIRSGGTSYAVFGDVELECSFG